MEENIKRLLEGLKRGEKTAFDQIFNLYHKRIYSFCRDHFHSKEDAEEVVQDVFLKVWNRKYKIDTSQNFHAYLYAIAKNTIYDNLKRLIKQKAEEEYKISQPKIINDTEDTVFYHDLEEAYNEALDRLPTRRREIFNLSRNHGLTNKEIAEKLNISLKTVETQMRLALDYFRKVLVSKVIKAALLIGFLIR